jgi:predicted transcriptional regulator
MNQQELPKGTLTIRLTEKGRQRLARLSRARDSNFTQVMNDALIHMLATYELRERIHAVVPSEQDGEAIQDAKDDLPPA